MNNASLPRAEVARATDGTRRSGPNDRPTRRVLALRFAFLATVLVAITVAAPQRANAAVNLEVRQSESASTLPSGTSLYTDANADGGKAVVYDAGATVNYDFGVSSNHRVTQVTVRSRNSSQSDASGTINIVVNGKAQTAKTISATATAYQDRSWAVNLSPGDHTIGVRGSNLSGSKRLYSDRVVLSGDIASTPTPTNTSNPFAGEKLYVDPNSHAARTVSQWTAAGRINDANTLKKISQSASSPYYMQDWTEDTGQAGMRAVTRYQANRWHADGSLPVLGLYAIPNRDCGSYSAGGFSTASEYRAWIDQAALGQQDFGGKIVWILEPDALASTSCLTDAQRAERYQLLAYAVDKLSAVGGKVYIDVGHAGWQTPETIIARLKQANVQDAAGFSLNNANFYTTSANISYGTQISQGVGGKHFVIDTSRNGLGPYFGTHSGDCPQWANPPGRALGERPTANTGHPLVDAYYWLKTPGASDADCGGFPRAGAWMPEYALGLAQRAAW